MASASRQRSLDPVELFDAYITEGMTISQIAARLGCHPETVRRALHRARIAVRPRGRPPTKAGDGYRRILDKSGYVLIRLPDHPQANSSGYVREHRLVMERHLGRLLSPEEVVHHINGEKADNRLENLRLYASNGEHKREDMKGNSWAKGDINNPKRSVRVFRSELQILMDLASLAAALSRPIRRVDLVPPWPSYRTVARAFGSWQEGVSLAIELYGSDGDSSATDVRAA